MVVGEILDKVLLLARSREMIIMTPTRLSKSPREYTWQIEPDGQGSTALSEEFEPKNRFYTHRTWSGLHGELPRGVIARETTQRATLFSLLSLKSFRWSTCNITNT